MVNPRSPIIADADLRHNPSFFLFAGLFKQIKMKGGMTKMDSKRVWKPGDEVYFWLPKLAGENSPEKVIVCSERGEDGTYFVM